MIVSTLHLEELKRSRLLSRLHYSILASACCTFSQSAFDLMGLHTLMSGAAIFSSGKIYGRTELELAYSSGNKVVSLKSKVVDFLGVERVLSFFEKYLSIGLQKLFLHFIRE